MAAHTPGPWGWDSRNSVKYLVTLADEPPYIVVMGFAVGCDIPDDERGLADQRLIAAAPDLLAALKGILAQFKAIQDHQNRLLVDGQDIESASANWDEATLGQFIDFTDAMKAVAKAEGR